MPKEAPRSTMQDWEKLPEAKICTTYIRGNAGLAYLVYSPLPDCCLLSGPNFYMQQCTKGSRFQRQIEVACFAGKDGDVLNLEAVLTLSQSLFQPILLLRSSQHTYLVTYFPICLYACVCSFNVVTLFSF